MTMLVLLGLAVAAVWVLSDFVYSRVVARRAARFEASIQRDEKGVQMGRNAYEVGDGEIALLLIHGIGDSPRVFRKMAPRLAGQGFTCRVMRLPGFAEPLPVFEQTTKEQWVLAVKGELESLRRNHDRVAVVAHSLGAAVAIALLVEHPRAVDAIVLMAPLVEVSNRRSPILPTRTWHELTKRLLLFTKLTETPFPIDANDPGERDDPGRSRFTPRQVFDEVFALIDGNRARSVEFATPLLMVLSRSDQVVDRGAAERFYARVSSTTKAILYAEEAGHAIPVDYGWEALTLEIVRFARRTS
jgi:carboxylesterase